MLRPLVVRITLAVAVRPTGTVGIFAIVPLGPLVVVGVLVLLVVLDVVVPQMPCARRV